MKLSQRQCMRIIVWVLALDIVLGVTLAAFGFSALVAAIVRAIFRG